MRSIGRYLPLAKRSGLLHLFFLSSANPDLFVTTRIPMSFRIEIHLKPGVPDVAGDAVTREILDLGVGGVTSVSVSDVYTIEGDLSLAEAEKIAGDLLADPLTQVYRIGPAPDDHSHVVEVAYNPGVMDPVEASVRKGIQDLGIEITTSVRTAKQYDIRGDFTKEEIQTLSESLLANSVIQHVVLGGGEPAVPGVEYELQIIRVPIRKADDDTLKRISREGQLSLNIEEMRAIRDHYRRLGGDPTDVELETLAQTWSEHCVHKTFKGLIEYEGEVIDNLLRSTVIRATGELNAPWCVSVFSDNAGVIEFDDAFDICFKVETHNHPSALEPYGGAGTGVGGVIRDILGTGLGAKPIANTDVFCFGPLDWPNEKLPKGCLHPKRLFKGVVSGVSDYGNRMGIPTLNGAICFDEGYIGNPLVYCGDVGLIPKGMSQKAACPGDMVVVVGGGTGRDGIHGATFSSDALTDRSETSSGGAVQIGNAITEKKMQDVLIKARDRGLYTAITDCGAGGLSSAVGEMGQEIGVVVELEKVPLKYRGLSYTECWISEAQERMVLAVPSEHLASLISLFRSENVEATAIGRFTSDRTLRLFYRDNLVGELDMAFLYKGLPRVERKATWRPPSSRDSDFEEPDDLTTDLIAILGSPNVCSKEWVIRQYDHEVQGGSVLKPLVGANNDGPGDAAVIQPVLGSKRGIAISNGINPEYGKIDPYHMAASAIDEAIRQIVAVGGSRKRTALLDNFCWGDPDEPDRLGGLVRAAKACYDVAIGYETPFISGKDSLNNEYVVDGKSIPIPPTLLISAIGIIEDVEKVVSMDLKAPGDLIYIVGLTKNELGGSHYYMVRGARGAVVPQVEPVTGKRVMDSVHRAILEGTVRACHDCSEGGIGVALSEMAFAGGLGAEVDLGVVPVSDDISRSDLVLFSESNTRFVIEVAPEHQTAFERAMAGGACGLIGEVGEGRQLNVKGVDGRRVVLADVSELKEAWQSPLRSP